MLVTNLQAQEEEVFRVVEEMPEFPGCEESNSKSARMRCSRKKLTDYIKDNLEYPQIAKENGVEGTTVVSFIVNKDGTFADVKVLRDVGGGCGEAALAVVNKMQADGLQWNPGKQRGVPVRVLFNLPVVFRLPKDAIVEDVVFEEMVAEDVAIDVDMEVPEPRLMQERPVRTMAEAPPPPPPVEEVYIPEEALLTEEVVEVEAPIAEEPPPPAVEEKVYIPEDALNMEEEIELPPPPPMEEITDGTPQPVWEAAPPPPPPPAPQVTKEIFRIVEDMPRFRNADCEALVAKQERKECAQGKMLEYVYSNLQYPSIAKENKVEGTVVVSFVVEKNGTVTDIRVLRDIGAGCGDETVRIVQSMNDNGPSWITGKQRGRPVRVMYNLPVKFKLEE